MGAPFRLTAALSVLACACTPAPAPHASAPVSTPGSASPAAVAPPPAPVAPFVVAIVVDQLSAWVAASRFPELPEDGGFARLRREGTWLKDVRYPYSVTDTGPGHAALHTGKVPAESGIFNNELPGKTPAAGRVSILEDERVKLVGENGPLARAGSSPSRLHVDTVADRLRAQHPEALVISVSVKDRGAILPAGRHPNYAMWFESSVDAFVTSTAYASTYPRWATAVGDHGAVVAARSRAWELGDAPWVKAHAATADDAPGEGDVEGLGTTFPHVGRTAKAFRGMPASDAVVAALGLAAVGAEYDRTKPTLLLLSFSTSDVVGHVFGPDSWEAWDHLRKLDALLGTVMTSLDRRVGAPVTVMLSADHGNVPMPEVPAARAGVVCPGDPWSRPCQAGGARMAPDVIKNELIAALAPVLGPGSFVSGVADPYVFLTREAKALPASRRALLDRTVRATLAAKHPTLAEVIDTRTLATECPALLTKALPAPQRAGAIESVHTMVCRSWPIAALDAGDYYLVPEPGSFFDSEIASHEAGTSHGTPWLFDRMVPLLVRAPGVIDAGLVETRPVDFSVYAALEAALVGVDSTPPRDVIAKLTAR